MKFHKPTKDNLILSFPMPLLTDLHLSYKTKSLPQCMQCIFKKRQMRTEKQSQQSSHFHLLYQDTKRHGLSNGEMTLFTPTEGEPASESIGKVLQFQEIRERRIKISYIIYWNNSSRYTAYFQLENFHAINTKKKLLLCIVKWPDILIKFTYRHIECIQCNLHSLPAVLSVISLTFNWDTSELNRKNSFPSYIVLVNKHKTYKQTMTVLITERFSQH